MYKQDLEELILQVDKLLNFEIDDKDKNQFSIFCSDSFNQLVKYKRNHCDSILINMMIDSVINTIKKYDISKKDYVSMMMAESPIKFALETMRKQIKVDILLVTNKTLCLPEPHDFSKNDTQLFSVDFEKINTIKNLLPYGDKFDVDGFTKHQKEKIIDFFDSFKHLIRDESPLLFKKKATYQETVSNEKLNDCEVYDSNICEKEKCFENQSKKEKEKTFEYQSKKDSKEEVFSYDRLEEYFLNKIKMLEKEFDDIFNSFEEEKKELYSIERIKKSKEIHVRNHIFDNIEDTVFFQSLIEGKQNDFDAEKIMGMIDQNLMYLK